MDTPPIVEGLDVVGNSGAGVSACRKGEPVDALGFQRSEEGFRQGVIQHTPVRPIDRRRTR